MAVKRKQKTKNQAGMKMEDRDQIRRQYKKKRDAMPDTLVHQLSLQISEMVLGWDIYQRAETVFFYYPLGKEVSLVSVIRDAWKNGKCVAFPKTAGDQMAFYETADLQELEEGCFHVMEPVTEGKQPVRQEPDLCFVPGTVFDLAGGRFGYGKGYYDRYFAEKQTVKLAGCAYGCQITEKLPADLWDVRMDYLLSESGILKIIMVEKEKVRKHVS